MGRMPRWLFLAWMEYRDLKWERQDPQTQLLHKLTHAVLNFLSKTPVRWDEVVHPADRRSPRWTEPLRRDPMTVDTAADQWGTPAATVDTGTPGVRQPPAWTGSPDVETMKQLSVGMIASGSGGRGKLVKKTRTRAEADALVRKPGQPPPPAPAPGQPSSRPQQ